MIRARRREPRVLRIVRGVLALQRERRRAPAAEQPAALDQSWRRGARCAASPPQNDSLPGSTEQPTAQAAAKHGQRKYQAGPRVHHATPANGHELRTPPTPPRVRRISLAGAISAMDRRAAEQKALQRAAASAAVPTAPPGKVWCTTCRAHVPPDFGIGCIADPCPLQVRP